MVPSNSLLTRKNIFVFILSSEKAGYLPAPPIIIAIVCASVATLCESVRLVKTALFRMFLALCITLNLAHYRAYCEYDNDGNNTPEQKKEYEKDALPPRLRLRLS